MAISWGNSLLMACKNSSHVKEPKSWVKDSTLWILQPRSQSSSAILDGKIWMSSATYVQENCEITNHSIIVI